MDFVKTSIKRPITVIMGMFIILMLGAVSASKMNLSLMPEYKLPYVIVYSSYTGAGPSEVENLLTKPLEQAISSVENVKKITSQSSNGISLVQVELAYNTNMDKAVSDIGESINLIEDYLPEESTKPVAVKLNMDMMPIAFLVASSPTMDDHELRNFVDQNIKNRLERLDGVASVMLSGGVEREIQVSLYENKLKGLGLDMASIAQILISENTDLAGGTVDYGDRSFSVSAKLKMENIDDIKNTPIILQSGDIIKLSEIARVSYVDKDLTSLSRNNNNNSIMLIISRSSDSNTVDAVKNIRKEVAKINDAYENANLEIAQESGKLIEDSIRSVISNIFIAAFLSMLVLMVFLKNIGLTGIIGISMPISIIGTFVFLYFSGTTLNMVSLGGLSIGVGMLVDNSIVVLENIYRHRTALEYDKVRGTYLGTSEVKTAVMASTITTLVVFLPFIFADGIVIQLMKDLALAVVFSLLMSLVTALTIVPMLSANYVNNIHRNRSKKFLIINKIFDKFDKFLKSLTKKYEKVLYWAIDKKAITLIFAVAFFVLSLCLTPFIGKEFLPSTDEGMFSINIDTPKGSNLQYMDKITKIVEDILYNYDEVTKVSTRVIAQGDGIESIFAGGTGGTITVNLVDKSQRTKSVDDIVEEIRQKTKNIAGAKITAQSTQSLMGGASSGGHDISINVYGDDIKVLQELSDEMIKKMETVKGLRQVGSSIDMKQLQAYVEVDKDKTRGYGLSGAQIANQIKNNVSGLVATKLKQDGTETDVRLTLPKTNVATYDDLADIKINTAMGTTVPLSETAQVGLEKVPTDIYRSDSTRFVQLTADIYGVDFGYADTQLQKIIDEMQFPSGYYAAMGEESEVMMDTFSSLKLVLLLAIALVYMVMASQFESLINPFIIMFTVPLAFSGGLVLMFLTKTTLSVMSIIGGLVLVGIVVNNGIVLIDYINTLRFRDGYDIDSAVKKACPTRLRPILMTAVTTILGQFPLIFSNGANSEIMKGMGMVIAGGLAVSTVLTLVIVPILYMIFDKIIVKFRTKFHIKPRANAFDMEQMCEPITKEEIERSQNGNG